MDKDNGKKEGKVVNLDGRIDLASNAKAGGAIPQMLNINGVPLSVSDCAEEKCDNCDSTTFIKLLKILTLPLTHPANQAGKNKLHVEFAVCSECKHPAGLLKQ